MKKPLFTSKIKTILVAAVALAILTTVAVAVSGGTAPAATASTYTVTITLQKSAVHTMEVLKDYPHAFLSQAEVNALSNN